MEKKTAALMLGGDVPYTCGGARDAERNLEYKKMLNLLNLSKLSLISTGRPK